MTSAGEIERFGSLSHVDLHSLIENRDISNSNQHTCRIHQESFRSVLLLIYGEHRIWFIAFLPVICQKWYYEWSRVLFVVWDARIIKEEDISKLYSSDVLDKNTAQEIQYKVFMRKPEESYYLCGKSWSTEKVFLSEPCAEWDNKPQQTRRVMTICSLQVFMRSQVNDSENFLMKFINHIKNNEHNENFVH